MLRLPRVSQDDDKGIWTVPCMWQCVLPGVPSVAKHQVGDAPEQSLMAPLHPQLLSPVNWGRVAVTALQLSRSNRQEKHLVPVRRKNQNNTLPAEFMMRQLIIPI